MPTRFLNVHSITAYTISYILGQNKFWRTTRVNSYGNLAKKKNDFSWGWKYKKKHNWILVYFVFLIKFDNILNNQYSEKLITFGYTTIQTKLYYWMLVSLNDFFFDLHIFFLLKSIFLSSSWWFFAKDMEKIPNK